MGSPFLKLYFYFLKMHVYIKEIKHVSLNLLVSHVDMQVYTLYKTIDTCLPFIVFDIDLLADERTTADVSSLVFAVVRA